MDYFAFASNLNRKQMSERAPSAKPRFSAILPNYKLIFSGWSRKWRGAVASIQQSHGDKVMGGIYEISEQDLAHLSEFEGPDYTTTRVVVFPDTGARLLKRSPSPENGRGKRASLRRNTWRLSNRGI